MAQPLYSEDGMETWSIVLGNGETWIGRAKDQKSAVALLKSEIPTYDWSRIGIQSIHQVFGRFGE